MELELANRGGCEWEQYSHLSLKKIVCSEAGDGIAALRFDAVVVALVGSCCANPHSRGGWR